MLQKAMAQAAQICFANVHPGYPTPALAAHNAFGPSNTTSLA